MSGRDNATFMTYRNATNVVTTLDGTANNQRYFVNTPSTLERVYEIAGTKSGSPIASTTTSTTFDGSGNATTIVTTMTDTDATAPASPYNGQVWTTTVVNTITPNTANWCLNLPTQTTVTKSSTTAPAITRTVGYTPDYIKCRMAQQIVEPGSATYKVTDDLTFGYDNFGNVAAESIIGLSMTTRASGTVWGTTGQFPTLLSNPLGQQSQIGYNFDLGFRTSVSDPNSIQTTWVPDNFARLVRENRPDGTYTTMDYSACGTSNNWCGTFNAATDLRMESYIKSYGVGGVLINQQYVSTDGYGRVRFKKHTDIAGVWVIEQTIYDALGRVSQQSVPYQTTAYFSTFHYDLLNRTKDVQRPISASNSALQTTSYTYQGRTTVTADPQSKSSSKVTQVTGNLGRSQDHNGYFQDFAYDAFGSLLSVKDSSAPVNTLFSATYDYGIAALQRTVNDIDRGNWTYSYDALGELKSYGDAKGQNFSYSSTDPNSPYDPLGRPVTRTEKLASGSADLATTWTWGNAAASHNIGQLQGITAVGAETYSEAYSFDAQGRLSNRTITPGTMGTQPFDLSYNATTGLLDTLTYPTSTSAYRLKLQYGYSNGLLQTIKDFNALTTVFWTANAENAFGEVTQETLGNGVVTNRAFDAVTGWMSANQAGVGGGTALLNQSYLFDLVGNVTQRQNNALGLTESICYDNLYRLDHTTATGVCTGTTSLQMAYDAMGDITSRSDVNASAAWSYDTVHKHQVRTAGAGNSYTYDANGNMITRNGNGISWTSYNYPATINATGESTTFSYGPHHGYWKQAYTGPSGVETTYYVGSVLERVDTGAGSDYRHYIVANGEQVAIYSRTSGGTNTLRYTLEDHQGSFSSILTSTGTSYVSESFAPFGARRNPATWSGAPSPGDLTLINGVTRAGYTGQAMLGNMGLIHMNGRVQDSITGRFLSPDPYVQDPGNPQNYNRYSYANNNPLSYTDPTGFSSNPVCRESCWQQFEHGYAPDPFYSCYGTCGWQGDLALVPYTGTITNSVGTTTEHGISVYMNGTSAVQSDLVGTYFPDTGNFYSANNPNFNYGASGLGLANVGTVSGFGGGAANESYVRELNAGSGKSDGFISKILYSTIVEPFATMFDCMLFPCGTAGGLKAVGGYALAVVTTPIKLEGAAVEGVAVIGRQVDTAVAKGWEGHLVLDLSPSEWSIAANDAFVNRVIEAGQSVYLASSTAAENLFNEVAGRATVFGREVQQFLDAGYQRVGDYLHPPVH